MSYRSAILAAASLVLFATALTGDRVVANSERIPPVIVQHPVTEQTAGDLLYYESDHRLEMGDKGEEAFDLSVKQPGCGEEALVFHDARLVYKERRFGEAKIVRRPTPGCFNCSPLTVAWYHEPTGFVAFQVHVYRKRLVGNCEVDGER